MADIINAASRFHGEVYSRHRALYEKLAREGQSPNALVISCADSRVVPELIAQAGPGELFVCRNAGNIVPPFAQMNGGVSSAIEYAVVALGVTDIVVCGHSGCGAMKGLMNPGSLEPMPNVAAWLRHASAARSIVCEAYLEELPDGDKLKALALENVRVQLDHLKTHPSVAAKLALGQVRLHGWYFEIESGAILALDGATGAFSPIVEGREAPIAFAPAPRAPLLAAAE